jgi:hypothetical protein
MPMPRFAFVALLLAAFCAPSAARAASAITVLPANPTIDDFVKIRLESNPARFNVESLELDGSWIFIKLQHQCFSCVGTESVELSVGRLPAGSYRVFADRFETIDFTVVPPAPTENELPRVDLSLAPAAATDNERALALVPIELRSCQEPEISALEQQGKEHRIYVELPVDDPDSECGQRLTAVRADLGQLAAGVHTAKLFTHGVDDDGPPTLALTKTFTVADAADAVTLLGRYRVSIAWETPEGTTGDASPVALRTTALLPVDVDASALFTYFDPTNWETLVKVLDGCAINGHRWVFLAAATDVAFTLTVDDLESDLPPYSYDSPAGSFTPPLTDTSAIPCVP